MVEEREPILMGVVGMKKVGKTFTTTQSIDKYTKPNSKTGKKGRKVLIYDINMEYTQYKAIDIKHLNKFTHQNKIEVRRILPINENGSEADLSQMLEILNTVIKGFRGGMLILEDINRYLIASKTVDVIGLLATNRHRDLDIICHFQSLSALDPRMWQNTAMIRFHYQMDDIKRYKNRIPNYELFKIAQCLVNYKYLKVGDKRFYCYVANDENYITGNFTRTDFKSACIEYLTLNSSLITNFSRRFGKAEMARKQATEQLCNELHQKYYRGI